MQSISRVFASLVFLVAAAGAHAARPVATPPLGAPCLFRPSGTTTLVNLNSVVSVRAYAGAGAAPDNSRWYVAYYLGTSSIEVPTDAKGAEAMLEAVAAAARACRA